jgi:hypothetical protein
MPVSFLVCQNGSLVGLLLILAEAKFKPSLVYSDFIHFSVLHENIFYGKI